MDNNQTILKELIAAQETSEAVALATVVKTRGSVPRHTGTKMLIYGNGRISGTIGGGEMESRVIEEAKAALTDGQTRVLQYTLADPKKGDPGVCGGEVEIYIEPYLTQATVFVIGCGHVGRAVADLAHWLDYQVVVTDDREELVTADYIPDADIYLPGTIEKALEQHKITPNTYITVVTRNVKIDREILPHLVKTPAPFIGIMGSQRRWETTRKLLIEDGLTESDLVRCHSPLGLELNAESPAEIAISVMAEIIMLRRQGTGERMAKERNHDQG